MKKLTIIALVVAMAAIFAVTSSANEWSLYGSARIQTFYTSEDLGKELELVAPNQFIAVDSRNAANQDNEKNTTWDLNTVSHVGAKIKGDMLEAHFEFGVTSDGGGGNVGTRLLYGIWKFAEGWGLKVGKDYTPVFFGLSNQVFADDANLWKKGNAFGDRRSQIAVEGGLGPGMLKVALINQTTNTLGTPNGVTEALIPKFEVSYEYIITDMMSVHGFGGYQTYDVKYADTQGLGGTSDFSVDSWVVGAGAILNFGPFFVKPQVSYYQNGAAAGWLGSEYQPFSKSGFVNDINAEFDAGLVLVGNDEVLDAKNLMAMLALGFKPTESLGLEFGVGYVGYETDSYQGVKVKNDYLEYYLQAVFTLAPGVYIVPEIGYRDLGKQKVDKPFYIVAPDVDLGSLFYAGAKWQIDF
jgi:hypothetical protein